MLTAIGPAVLRVIVNTLIGGRAKQSVSVSLLLVFYVGSLWLARTINEIRELSFARARQRILRNLSEGLFAHLMHLPLRFHLDRKTGAVTETLDSGLAGLRSILHHLVFTYIPVLVELGTVLVVLLRVVAPGFLFLLFGAVAAYSIAFGCSVQPLNRSARRAMAARIDAAAVMTDGLLNYETVKYFCAETLVQRRVSSALSHAESESLGFCMRSALNGVVTSAIFAAFVGGTIFYASDEVRRGRMTLGDFVLVNTYALQVVRPIEMMGYANQGLSSGVAMLDRLVRLFREATEKSQSGQHLGSGPGTVEFEGISLSYGCHRQVLRSVSFGVAGGKVLGIVGRSGSGKSTIVRLLMRLLEPESGAILLDGIPIQLLSLRELRRVIAVVPQETMLFDETVRYNISLGCAEATLEQIQEAAGVAQLHDVIMNLPSRYDTVVGERGMKLSGGERQRISIARAVLKSPKIYVFDEATSSLDSRTEGEILRSLRAVALTSTTIVIAHRLSAVEYADEIVVLENGDIAERGTHGGLLRRNGIYAELWNAQGNRRVIG
ncbi:MAG: ABC transporter ATP-binding protein [Proteobacteria bacterium]|nr:ABC transporter ATP-binding protein [Pseudomonadota bacterium]